MRKTLALIALVLTLSLLSATSFAAAAPVKAAASSQNPTELFFMVGDTDYFIDDDMRTLDVAPFIREGRTLVPIRFLMEALGGNVSWDQAKNEVAIDLQGRVIKLWINKAQADVNGVSMPIDSTNAKVVPIIEKSRTFIPLRFVLEAIDSEVVWDPDDKSITVRYPKPALQTYDGSGYSISYPENWELFSGSFAMFATPEGNNVIILYQDLSAEPTTLDEYSDVSIAGLRAMFPDIEILESASTTLGGSPARKIVYTTTQLDTKMQLAQVWTIRNDTAYIVSYTASAGLYPNYSGTFQRMLDSFTFK